MTCKLVSQAASHLKVSILLLLTLCCLSLPATGALAQAGSQQMAELGYEVYQVRSGDTVENVAARFGITPRRIRLLNHLPSDTALEPGQSLAVPLALSHTQRRSEGPADSPASTLSAKPLPAPRYATVTAFSEIRSKPTAAPAQLLYRVQTGTQLIVTSECQEWWGVVMADGSTGWIAKAALQLTDQTITPDQLNLMLQGARPDVVKEAFRYLGTPYRYGGRLPYDVDCSLLVQAAFAARGIPLPRTAAAQFEVGRRVGYSELLPGDRLYFVSSSGRVNHAGIYIGDGRFIHASSRRRCVAVDSLGDSRYWTRFIGACRS